MTPIHIRVVAAALCMACGSVGSAGSMLVTAKDQHESGVVSSKRMPDGKQWMTENLKVDTPGSYYYDALSSARGRKTDGNYRTLYQGLTVEMMLVTGHRGIGQASARAAS